MRSVSICFCGKIVIAFLLATALEGRAQALRCELWGWNKAGDSVALLCRQTCSGCTAGEEVHILGAGNWRRIEPVSLLAGCHANRFSNRFGAAS